MRSERPIDTARHPLASGYAPEWASEWGQDPYGVFAAFTLGGVTQRLRWVPPGRFLMGSPEDETRGLAREDYEREWFRRERPRHPAVITQGFWLFDTPCTQALWETVTGGNPSRFQSPSRPVEQVNWHDARGFLDSINARVPGLALALPTEAQWEYACRAGTGTALYTGPLEILGRNDAPALDPIAWYGGNSGVGFELEHGYDGSGWSDRQYPNAKSGTHPVALKKPNSWGLYDMLGNVFEWCRDGPREYSEQTAIDPVGSLDLGAGRVIRGGSWDFHALICRSAVRGRRDPAERSVHLGFRCASVSP